MFFSVTERSEDTGLVYTLSVVRLAEISKFTMKITSLLKNRARSSKKLILAISGQKKIVEDK